MKSDQTIIRKNHMELLHFITNLLDIKDPNIKSVDIINMDPPKGNHWRNMIFKNRLRFHTLKRLACLPKFSLKSASLSTIIAQKLVEKTSMTDIAHQLSISTSTVIRKLNDFRFNHDFSRLPEIMSWDEYAFTKGKMSFIAQDFDKLNIITVLEGMTRAVIRNHFLRYDRAVRCQVKIITMDMFSPYYDLAKRLRFRISRLRLKQSTRLFHSQMQKLYWIVFILSNT